MLFLNILAGICIVLVVCLVIASVKYDLDNEYVSIYSPMGFLLCIHYTCLYLSEKRKRSSEKKPWNRVIMVFDYFILVGLIVQICVSLMIAGLDNSFLPLIPAVTNSLAVAAIFFYVDEKRKSAPLENRENESP